tara:strand:- start:764 stop:970 length:207 start_codon:yes stop_codon:yes gene_type:complete
MSTKSFEEAQSITQPVIYVGVERQEAKGFNKVVLIQENKEGLQTTENHVSGDVSVQMVNGVLRIYVKS